MSNTTGTLSNINFMSMEKYNSLETVSENELYAVRVNPYSSEPHDITLLKEGTGSLFNANSYLNLSESWKNFEEIVFVASSSTTGNKLTAYRTSTYWLDKMLQETGNPLVWSNMGDAYLTVSSYSETSNPSTVNDLYVNGHAYCYLRKVYGVNRKVS